jgi:hypothetical protein
MLEIRDRFFIRHFKNVNVCIHHCFMPFRSLGLNLIDPILWASILEDSKLSGVLGASSWVVWIHEKLQLDPLRLVCVSPINLVHLLHLGNKRNGGILAHRR